MGLIKKYEYVEPDLGKWPIVQLTRKRGEFIRKVSEESLSHLLKNGSAGSLIEEAVYLEKIRLTEKPWKVDKVDEPLFWANIRKQMLRSSPDKEGKLLQEKEIMNSIVRRYSNEIAGNFKIPTFNFARKFVPVIFSRFLNAASNRTWRRFFSQQYQLKDKIHTIGDADHVRKLSRIGTVILVPTHFSNMDPFLIGYAIDALGLQPFLYGAGLNLYNNSLEAYFINRLGAYKVDRRKKNQIYLETLKAYSRLAISQGCHSLFFPGGTRSRSGGLETKLKLGLLGTAMESQLLNFQRDGEKAKKIFVLPLVISYHFVVEASSLVEEYLKSTGREKYYIENDQFSSLYKVFRFLWDFFGRGSEISLSLGKPMDLFGNYVDEEGRSFSNSGKEVDVREYFISGGELKADPQRDAEYTRNLGQKIVESYFQWNIVFSSHLVAFAAFEVFKKNSPKLDLFGLLRIPEDFRTLSYQHFFSAVEKIMELLREMEKNGKVKLALHLNRSTNEIIKHGLRNLGLYHTKSVLFQEKDGSISCSDMKLLYFYHNRLAGYKLKV